MSTLDPFRAVISVISRSDMLVRAASAAGLQFDAAVGAGPMSSHDTRIRALTPEIFKAYDALSNEEKVLAANAAFGAMRERDNAVADRATEALNKIGWGINDGQIVVATAEVREVFFPKGSQWDAFVVIRGVFAQAARELVVVDAYCDAILFEILAARDLTAPLNVKIRPKNRPAVRIEASRFTQQHASITFEIRQTRDFHDRFVVIDGATCVHVGASLNRAGNTAFMVSKIEDDQNRLALLAQVEASWNAGTVVN